MSLAPDWNVAENESPFTPLPMLLKCAHCRTPLGLLDAMVFYDGEVAHAPLCRTCSNRASDHED